MEALTLRPATEPVIRVTAMPADANAYGDIFGGWLLCQMDMGQGCWPRAIRVAGP
jgi:acyl-CoA thioesterase YciA